MTARPDIPARPARLLTRDEAAAYVRLSATAFDIEVAAQ
jgi:hypothetical protein